MNQLEENVVNSFRLVKSDIIKMQNTIAQLSENQKRLIAWVFDTRNKETELYQRVKQMGTKKTLESPITAPSMPRFHKKFVASKMGNLLHEMNCPFAKNIKPMSKIIFSSKNAAFNKGYKPCECLKRV